MFFSRLDKYMSFKGINDNKLTIQAGLSNGIIGKARKRGALSQENISKILHTYRDLDANWLFTGEGGMLKQDFDPKPQEHESYKELAEARKEIIALKDEKIAQLEREIERLKMNLNSTLSKPKAKKVQR